MEKESKIYLPDSLIPFENLETSVFPGCECCRWRDWSGRCLRSMAITPGGEPAYQIAERYRQGTGELDCGRSGKFWSPKIKEVERIAPRFHWVSFWIGLAVSLAVFWSIYAVIRLESKPSANPAAADISITRRLSR